MTTKNTRKKKLAPRSAGAEIIEGLTEVRDILKEGVTLEEKFTVRTVQLDLEPQEYDPQLVLETRNILQMSQAIFALFLGVEPRTVQSWEQGLRTPSPIARRFMDELRLNPDYWKKRLLEEAEDATAATN